MSEPTSENTAMRWYVLQTRSGFEVKARESLLESIQRHGLDSLLGEVIVPMENVVEVRNGERVERKEKFLPSYILVQLELTRPMWHAIKAANHVVGFVGGRTEPTPVPLHEVERIRGHMEQGLKAPKAVLSFRVGDQVKVIDGPFKNFSGTVEEVNADKSKVRVLVSIFGRATPVELDFVQVEPTA
jgi:transcriptional antiterminator NusG